MLRNIDYSKYDVDLILFEGLGDYINEIPQDVNIKFYDLTKTYGSFKQCIEISLIRGDLFTLYLRLIFMLEKFFGKKVKCLLKLAFRDLGKYDCAIAYRIGICTEFVLYVVNANKKITWWHHGSFDYDEKQTNTIQNIYNKFDYIVSVSEGCKRILLERFHNIENKLVVIPNIIDSELIIEKAIEEVNIFDNKDDYMKIISIGRLSPEKGMINCVYVCKKLVQAGYNIKWYLIGDGVEYESILTKIKNNNLENSIYLLGNISNPYPYIKKADIFVHPSYVESMSITVLEAMTLEIPVVVAKSIGPSEFIKNNENGILVESTVKGLYEGIIKLINNKTLYDRLCLKDDNILKNYTSKNVLNKLYNLVDN